MPDQVLGIDSRGGRIHAGPALRVGARVRLADALRPR